MDRGTWIKNFRKKEKRRTQKKGQKSKRTKVQNSMGMRNKQIFLLTICYNPVVSQAGSYPKVEVKNETHIPGLKRVFWTLKSWFPFSLNWTIINDLKYIHLPFGKSRHLEEFNMLVFIVKTVCWSRKILFRDPCSPRSHQFFQLQPFFPIFLNFGPSFWFYLTCNCFDSWTLFFLCHKFGFLMLNWGQLFSFLSEVEWSKTTNAFDCGT